MIGNAVVSAWQDMGYLNPDRVMVSAYTMGAQVTPLTKCQVVWQDSPLPLQQGDDLRDRLTLWLIAPASASGNKSDLSGSGSRSNSPSWGAWVTHGSITSSTRTTDTATVTCVSTRIRPRRRRRRHCQAFRRRPSHVR